MKASEIRRAGEPGQSARWVLASLSLSMLLPSLGTSIANVALPTLAEAFAASFQDVQWVVLAYLLATTTSIVSVGRLGDLVGRRRLLLVGIVLFTAASTVCGAAPVLWVMVAARGVQGIGAAIMLALTMAFVGETVPKAHTGRAMGLLGTMSAVGTALGPTLGGLLIACFGWQAIYLVNLPLGALALVLAYRLLPADRQSAGAAPVDFDVPGSLLLTLSLGAYALAMTIGRGRFGLVNVAMLVAAGAGLLVFIRVQARAASPLISLVRLRDPALRSGLWMSALVSTVVMATLVVGPFHLARAARLDMALVGIAMSLGPAVAAIMGVPAGRIVDRFGTQRVTAWGLAGILVGCVAVSVAPQSLGLAGYLIPVVVLTGHYALFQTANNAAVMGDVAAEQRGVMSGLLNLARNLGLITGASVMGAVFALASQATDVTRAIPEGVAFGTRVTFAVAAAIVCVALTIARGRRAPSQLVHQPASRTALTAPQES
jgi:MFS family permease